MRGLSRDEQATGVSHQTFMPPITFGRWIKKLRAEQDLTQEMLSELVGCATPTLRSLEIGTRRPSREMAERIADTLKVPAEQRSEFLRLARPPAESATDEPPTAQAVNATASDQPPMPVLSALPPVINPLIGREAERNALRTLLIDEPGAQRARLVTIVGAGGMGKTRLALDVAATLGAMFADGVAFVALAALQQAQHLPFTLAEALGITLQGVIDVRQHVLAQVSTRTLLLVLDNFEHLLADPAAISWVKELIQRAPGVQLLITSRERLRISGERTFELAGLALPTPTATPAQDQAEALTLFLARAQQADSAFVLDASNRAAVVRICHLLGGMPLGIELAAAWVRTLSCAEIADEIARNIDFLELADRDAMPRHRNMRAVFDHSWQLLSAAEQQLLAGLAYFRGGCTRQAAEQVSGATLPLLASLIDKSLLARGEGSRFLLHELIRQFAAERLQADQARWQEIGTQHASYYSAFLRRNQSRMESAQQHTAMLGVTAESDNLLLAWEWICAHQQAEAVEPFVLVFGYVLDIRGHHQLNAQLMDRGVQAFQQHHLPNASTPSDQQVGAQALLHGARGYSVARLYRPQEARQDLQQGLALAQQSEEGCALFYTNLWSGFVLSTMGEFPQGIAHLHTAVQLSHDRQRSWEEGIAHMLLGLAYNLSGDAANGYPAALTAYHHLRTVGDPHAIAICVSQLSSLIEATGLGSELFDSINESLRSSSDQGDEWARAMWLTNMGIAAHRRGELAAASAQLQESIHLLTDVNELWGSTFTQVRLAQVLLDQGKAHEAEQLLLQVIEKANTAQMLHTQIDAQIGLAYLWLQHNKREAATPLLAQLRAQPALTPVQRSRVEALVGDAVSQ